MTMAVLLQVANEPYRVPWGDLVRDYVGFIAYFAVFGSLGFYFVVLRGMRAHLTRGAEAEGGGVAPILRSASTGGAVIGLVGTLLLLGDQLAGVAASAAEKNVAIADAFQKGGSRLAIPLVLGAVILVAFAVAARGVRWAWTAALVAGLMLGLRSLTTGKWTALVNPVHELAASFWLGTLLVLVVVGLPTVLRSGIGGERRGALVADLVAHFSPLALAGGAVLGLTGVITAWRHLKFVAALWTTAYGLTLDIKLVLVAVVFSLGAWNWRRMTPRLGPESAAYQLRRSARTELLFAAIVLAITAVLVSLPTPRVPH